MYGLASNMVPHRLSFCTRHVLFFVVGGRIPCPFVALRPHPPTRLPTQGCTCVYHTYFTSMALSRRVGKMLVYGAVLACLDPVLTIAAAMAHGRPVFMSPRYVVCANLEHHSIVDYIIIPKIMLVNWTICLRASLKS